MNDTVFTKVEEGWKHWVVVHLNNGQLGGMRDVKKTRKILLRRGL